LSNLNTFYAKQMVELSRRDFERDAARREMFASMPKSGLIANPRQFIRAGFLTLRVGGGHFAGVITAG
jgi:hypothetical protein